MMNLVCVWTIKYPCAVCTLTWHNHERPKRPPCPHKQEPKYGLHLQQEFEAGTGKVSPLNIGQVYATLQRLERDGLIETDNIAESPQKSFRITPQGGQALAEWLRTPPDLSSPPRNGLVIVKVGRNGEHWPAKTVNTGTAA